MKAKLGRYENSALYSKMYFLNDEKTMWALIHLHGIEKLNTICKQHGVEHESILQIFVKSWWSSLLEYGCQHLPLDINFENRLDQTPLACCFYPNDYTCKEYYNDPDKVLQQGLRCILVLLKHSADPNRESFRHLSKPFKMGSITIDSRLLKPLNPQPPVYEAAIRDTSQCLELEPPPIYDENG